MTDYMGMLYVVILNIVNVQTVVTQKPLRFNIGITFFLYNLKNECNAEYLVSYSTLKPFIVFFQKQHRHLEKYPVLVPGCGDSPFCAQIHVNSNYEYTVATDKSSVAIEVMNLKQQHPGLYYLIDDMSQSSLQSETFGTIFDKSLIDCVWWCDDKDVNPEILINEILNEFYRVLIPGGIAWILTTRIEDEFLPFVKKLYKHNSNKVKKSKDSGLISYILEWGNVEIFYIVVETKNGRVEINATATMYDSFDEACIKSQSRESQFFCVYILQK